jgi:WD40 repeat protein
MTTLEFVSSEVLVHPTGVPIEEHSPPTLSWRTIAPKCMITMRALWQGIKVAKAAVISVALGFFLFYAVPQAQDLFLEVRGSIAEGALFWIAFYLAVLIGWVLPVYISTRWALSQFPAGTNVVLAQGIAVEAWVRRALPPVLAALCLAAVLAGQLVSLRNAPTAVGNASLWSTDGAMVCIMAGPLHCGSVRFFAARAFLLINRIVEFAGSGNNLALSYSTLALAALWFAAAGVVRPAARGWRIARQVVFWVPTIIVVVPAVALAVSYLFLNVSTEFGHKLNLAHLLLLPLTTTLVGWVLWLGVSRMLMGLRSKPDSREHGSRQLTIVFFGLLALSVALVAVLLIAHPVSTSAFIYRALLVPALLGLLVPFFAWLTCQSMKVRFPLALSLISLVIVFTSAFPDTHDVRKVPAFLLSRDEVEESVTRWARVNGCRIERTDVAGRYEAPGCPQPIIVSAAGGASRAAFLVGGLIGTLMDETTAPIIEGHEKQLEKVWLSPDGRKVLTSSTDFTLRLWDSENGRQLAVLHGHKREVSKADFSPDGLRILTLAGDSTARLWDANDGRQVALLRVGTGQTNSAEFSPDGRQIVATFTENVARIWYSDTGAVAGTLRGHRGTISSASYSPDGRRLATVSVDGTARIWDAATMMTRDAPLELTTPGSNLLVNADAAVFSADGRRLLTTANRDRPEARLWDVETGALITTIADQNAVRFTPDGNRLVSEARGKLAIWNGMTGQRIIELDVDDAIFLHVSLSPDGQLIAVPGREPVWLVLRTQDGGLVATIKPEVRGFFLDAAFTSDSRRLVTKGDDVVELWEADSGRRIGQLGNKDAKAFALSQRGNRLATANLADVLLWDAMSGSRLSSIPAIASRRSITERRALRPFGQQLFAISAVSGGAVSAVMAYAALADSQMAERATNGIGKPPCRKDSKSDQWFAPYVKDGSRGTQPWQPYESWKGCLELLLSGDFLSPVFLSLISSDLLQLGYRGDRAATLEQAWEMRYASITADNGDKICSKNPPQARELKATTLASAMTTVRACVLTESKSNWLPVLLLNGTSVATGRRIVASDVRSFRANDIPGRTDHQVVRTFTDAYDLHELMTGEKVEMFESGDIRLSTGATMSARFPIISPHGNIRDKEGRIVDRVVDGGYFENYGAITSLEIANALRRYGLKPFIVVVNNEPSLPKLDCVTDESFLPHPRVKETVTFSTLSSPLGSLLATGSGRATLAAVQLCNEIGSENFTYITVAPDKDNPEKGLSMSWWLSMHVQKYLDEQLAPEGINKAAFAKITTVR